MSNSFHIKKQSLFKTCQTSTTTAICSSREFLEFRRKWIPNGHTYTHKFTTIYSPVVRTHNTFDVLGVVYPEWVCAGRSSPPGALNSHGGGNHISNCRTDTQVRTTFYMYNHLCQRSYKHMCGWISACNKNEFFFVSAGVNYRWPQNVIV